MKKKFKWLINVATLVLCVCALAIGVYAAKQASLTATGTIGFKAHGLDLSITGTMYGHATTKDGQAVTSADPTALTSTFTDGTGTMTLGNMYFSDLGTEVEDIVITLTIQNNTLYAVEGVLSLPTTFNTISFEKTNNPIVQIGASSTATMTIVMTLTDTQTEITDTENNFSFTINFTKLNLLKTAKFTTAQAHDIDYVADSSYYYVSMGSAVLNKNQVTEVRWLPFAEKQTDGTWKHFDKKNKPSANKEYYFISEYTLDASESKPSIIYANNLSGSSYSFAQNLDYPTLDQQNYVSSNIRAFLKSNIDNQVYTSYTYSYSESDGVHSFSPSGEKVNLLTQYSIEDSYIYSKIIGRNVLNELYETTSTNDTKDEILATGLVTTDTIDKLWILSLTELAYFANITPGATSGYVGVSTSYFRSQTQSQSASNWWLRSFSSQNIQRVYGTYDWLAPTEAKSSEGARPAFQLTIPA